MARQSKKRPGRPPLPPTERKRRNFTFRSTDAMQAQLQVAAAASGRSISEEIEHRLERSLAEEEQAKLFSFMAPHNLRLARQIAICADIIAKGSDESWVTDVGVRSQLRGAVNELIDPSTEADRSRRLLAAELQKAPVHITQAEEHGRRVANAVRDSMKLGGLLVERSDQEKA